MQAIVGSTAGSIDDAFLWMPRKDKRQIKIKLNECQYDIKKFKDCIIKTRDALLRNGNIRYVILCSDCGIFVDGVIEYCKDESKK